MDEVYLRPAKEGDMDLLYEWANEKHAREHAFNTGSIEYEEHIKWFHNAVKDENILIYLYCHNGIPIGQVRLNVQPNSATVSYSIDYRHRGQGHGKNVIILIEKEAFSKRNVVNLNAKVKRGNVASQVIFERLGYKKTIQKDYYEYNKRLDGENDIFMNNMGINGGVLFLTNNRNSIELYEYLEDVEENIHLYSGRICLEQLRNTRPRFIISYNYNHIIRQDVIDFMKGNLVNLHTSLLPWNRGTSPNFWSFVDNTPKGVTIHEVDEGLDTGPILIQKELYFDEDAETFRSSYDKLNWELKELFKKNWEAIKTGTLPRKSQNFGGSRHDLKDLKEMDARYGVDWNERIVDFKRRLKRGG